MNVTRWMFLFTLFLGNLDAHSQTTLLHRRSASMMKRNESSGHVNNLGNTFYTRTTGIGWVLPTRQSGDVEVEYGKSWLYSNHHRFTKNMHRFLAYGMGLGFQIAAFEIKQQTYNLLSPNILFQRQRMFFYSLPVDFFLRQNWQKSARGNGIFTSFGIQGAYYIYQVLVNQEKLDPATNQGVAKRITYNSRLDYINRWSYYGSFRFGKGHFSLAALYRLNEIFRPSTSINNGAAINDLPKWMGVLEINIWSKNKSAKKDEDEL
jgi:hypothetical protein